METLTASSLQGSTISSLLSDSVATEDKGKGAALAGKLRQNLCRTSWCVFAHAHARVRMHTNTCILTHSLTHVRVHTHTRKRKRVKSRDKHKVAHTRTAPPHVLSSTDVAASFGAVTAARDLCYVSSQRLKALHYTGPVVHCACLSDDLWALCDESLSSHSCEGLSSHSYECLSSHT